MINFAVFDLEISKLPSEVQVELGLASEREAFGFPHLMGFACAVAYDSRTDNYITFEDCATFGKFLLNYDGVLVSFNGIRFDLPVLLEKIDIDVYHALQKKPHIDILAEFYKAVDGKFRVSLDNLTRNTCGVQKSDSGAEAPLMFRRGEWDRLVSYCKNDVKITADLFKHGLEKGFVKYYDNQTGRVTELNVNYKEVLDDDA